MQSSSRPHACTHTVQAAHFPLHQLLPSRPCLALVAPMPLGLLCRSLPTRLHLPWPPFIQLPALPGNPSTQPHLVRQRQPELDLAAQLGEGPLLVQRRLQQCRRRGVLPPRVGLLPCGELHLASLLLAPQLLRALRKRARAWRGRVGGDISISISNESVFGKRCSPLAATGVPRQPPWASAVRADECNHTHSQHESSDHTAAAAAVKTEGPRSRTSASFSRSLSRYWSSFTPTSSVTRSSASRPAARPAQSQTGGRGRGGGDPRRRPHTRRQVIPRQVTACPKPREPPTAPTFGECSGCSVQPPGVIRCGLGHQPCPAAPGRAVLGLEGLLRRCAAAAGCRCGRQAAQGGQQNAKRHG